MLTRIPPCSQSREIGPVSVTPYTSNSFASKVFSMIFLNFLLIREFVETGSSSVFSMSTFPSIEGNLFEEIHVTCFGIFSSRYHARQVTLCIQADHGSLPERWLVEEFHSSLRAPIGKRTAPRARWSDKKCAIRASYPLFLNLYIIHTSNEI